MLAEASVVSPTVMNMRIPGMMPTSATALGRASIPAPTIVTMRLEVAC